MIVGCVYKHCYMVPAIDKGKNNWRFAVTISNVGRGSYYALYFCGKWGMDVV